MIRKAVRELDRDRQDAVQSEEAREGHKEVRKGESNCHSKDHVKDLVRNKNYVNRFIMMKTQLTAVGLKIQTIKSNEAMSSARKDVSKCLVLLNKQMSVPELQKRYRERIYD